MVDEAYREFLDPSYGDPVRELIPDHPNVVVTRTFSKAQGLAGIRIGYAVGHPDVIAAVDKTLFPFAVNAIAQAAGIAAIDAEGEIGERVAAILAERSRVAAALTAAGWELPDTQANFVYLPIGARTDEVYLGARTPRRGDPTVQRRRHPRDDLDTGRERPLPRHARCRHGCGERVVHSPA